MRLTREEGDTSGNRLRRRVGMYSLCRSVLLIICFEVLLGQRADPGFDLSREFLCDLRVQVGEVLRFHRVGNDDVEFDACSGRAMRATCFRRRSPNR